MVPIHTNRCRHRRQISITSRLPHHTPSTTGPDRGVQTAEERGERVDTDRGEPGQHRSLDLVQAQA
jgi:hypothetical protein